MLKTGAVKKQTLSHAAFFLTLNLLDYLTTHTLISMDGEELMPLGYNVIEAYGMPGLLAYKLFITFVILAISIRFKFQDSLWGLLNGAFTGVVLWNNLGIFSSLFFN